MATERSAITTPPTDGGTRSVAAALGVCVGLSGLDHGFFEILQGNTPTPGLVVQAIGPGQRMWAYGTEEAFTLLPNFLLSGVLAMLVGAAVIIWSLRFIDRPSGSRVFLGLGGLMFLVGGGIGMLVFLLSGWAMARRIGRPPLRLRMVPAGVANVLWRARRVLIAIGLALYAFALEVAILGYVPGVSDPDLALNICWGALLGTLAAFFAAFLGANAPAHDTDSVHAAPTLSGASVT